MSLLGADNILAAIDNAVSATGQSDEYFRGMCNGMLFVKSLIDGKEPEYFGDAEEVSKRFNAFREASEPLLMYLRKYGDQHTSVIVTQHSVVEARNERYVPMKAD